MSTKEKTFRNQTFTTRNFGDGKNFCIIIIKGDENLMWIYLHNHSNGQLMKVIIPKMEPNRRMQFVLKAKWAKMRKKCEIQQRCLSVFYQFLCGIDFHWRSSIFAPQQQRFLMKYFLLRFLLSANNEPNNKNCFHRIKI